MQTSRELVKRAIEMNIPDRVPVWISFDGGAYNQAVLNQLSVEWQSDVNIVGYKLIGFKSVKPGYNVLGYKMETFGETMGEVKEPPLADYANFEKWKRLLPDYGNPENYAHLKQFRADHPDLFLIGRLNMMMEELINHRIREIYDFSL